MLEPDGLVKKFEEDCGITNAEFIKRLKNGDWAATYIYVQNELGGYGEDRGSINFGPEKN